MKISLLIIGVLIAPDALAWGLQTHVFLAQWLLAAAPFADPQIRAAALRLPRLVLAGACLPDLALIGRMLGFTAFQGSHQWSTLRRLATTCWDEERAIAIGYASHLLADVVAHNHFVPEYERRLVDLPHATHALCEWAMDRHLHGSLDEQPAELLRSEMPLLTEASARTFACGEGLARRGILLLARAERALRVSGVPSICAPALRMVDADAYLAQAKAFVRHAEPVLRGAEPRWLPEPGHATRNEAPAMSAPSTAPAITSLG